MGAPRHPDRFGFGLDYLDRLGQRAVTGDWPRLVSIGADHVSQRVRVTGIALGTRDGMAFPKTAPLAGG